MESPKEQEILREEQEILREVLAGHHGHCDDYQLTSRVGQARQPFTWLSSSSFAIDNERCAGELLEFKNTRKAVWFEAWEFKNDQWQVVLSNKVQVIYAEVDTKLSKVRALLQWASTA